MPRVTTSRGKGRFALAALLVAFCAVGAWIWLDWNSRNQNSRFSVKSANTQFQLENEEAVYSTYAGSESCRDCHQDQYDLWSKSDHALAERKLLSMDEAAFSPSRAFVHGTQTSRVGLTNGIYSITAPAKDGLRTFAVERVIANSPLRQFLIPFPGGRLQATEAAWDPRSNEWFNVYGEEDRQPGEWGHWTGRGMNWNSMCATCHNTRVRKNYDPATDTYRTVMAESGAGCEACHGAMKDHNEWQYANKGKGLKDPTARQLDREQMFDTCAACHSRRVEITGDPRPGDRFLDHHLPAIVDASETFYADGQVRDENYEFAAFLGSRMFHKGVRCVDCHNFHSGKTRGPGNFLCLSCHAPGTTNAIAIDPLSHSRHKVFGYDTNGVFIGGDLTRYAEGRFSETGGECVNCHMPQTVYMQRDSRHDHGFTIPDPLLTKQFGIPNACNRCHADKSVDWSLEHVERWYGSKMDRPYRRRAQAVASARRGEPAARDALIEMLENDESAYWRAVAANLLARWAAEPGVSRALIRNLENTNALVRQAAVQALGSVATIENADVFTALQRRVNDSSRNVRVQTAGILASALDDGSLALREYEHFLAHISDQPLGRLQAGFFELDRGNAAAALNHFRTAVVWDPGSADIREETAVVLSELGQPTEAIVNLEEAAKIKPDDAELRFKLALAYGEVNRTDRVVRELERAVELNPNHVRAWYNLGLARAALGNNAGALDALLRSESIDPRDAKIPYARATILFRLGRTQDAFAAARRVLELDPEHREASALLRELSAGNR